MFNSEIRGIWLFFYLIFLDKNKATTVAAKAIDLFFESVKKAPQMPPKIILIKVTKKILEKHGKNFEKTSLHTPKNIVHWEAFRFQADLRDIQDLIWGQVLKIPVEQISMATGDSKGTINYRISNGIGILIKTMEPQQGIESTP